MRKEGRREGGKEGRKEGRKKLSTLPWWSPSTWMSPVLLENFTSNYLLSCFFCLFLIYFWLCWVFVAVCGLSLVVARGGFSCCGAQALGMRSSVVEALGLSSCNSRALERVGFSSYGSWALECRLSSCGWVAPWHVGSFWTRARTRVPCIGRWILNHCATREVLLP